mmetsp:Transcript_20514/g.50603  ORF Transcript_20514/g.50603 Transcript_20514/m.50603 type:complete len:160 (+) Transcript_20514:2707-3186(+)
MPPTLTASNRNFKIQRSLQLWFSWSRHNEKELTGRAGSAERHRGGVTDLAITGRGLGAPPQKMLRLRGEIRCGGDALLGDEAAEQTDGGGGGRCAAERAAGDVEGGGELELGEELGGGWGRKSGEDISYCITCGTVVIELQREEGDEMVVVLEVLRPEE